MSRLEAILLTYSVFNIIKNKRTVVTVVMK